MHRHRLLPSLLLALTIGACAASETPPPVDEAAIRDAIQAREREWSAAYAAGDAAAVANLYTEDGAQVQATGDWRRGRAAIAAGMKAELDTLNVTAREDIPVVGKILAHLGLLHPADSPGPAPPSADLRVAAPSHQ